LSASLDLIGNIGLNENKHLAGDADNALVGPATSGWRQFRRGSVGDVNANDGKITIGEFKDVRATTATDGFRSVLVRVGAEPAKEYELRIHAAPESVKYG
jgi:hypothetical protein